MTRFAPNDCVSLRLNHLQALLTPADRRVERRRGVRAAFPYRMRVAAAAMGRRDELQELPGEEFVVGRDLSEAGLGFEHDIALPYRRVLLSAADDRFEDINFPGIQIELLLNWCRFCGSGYESGGRILRSSIAEEAVGPGDRTFF